MAIFAACGTHIGARFSTLEALKTECVNTFVLMVCLVMLDVVVDLAITSLPVPFVSLPSSDIVSRALLTRDVLDLAAPNAGKTEIGRNKHLPDRGFVFFVSDMTLVWF